MTATPQQRIERRMQAFVGECTRRKQRRPDAKTLRDLHARMVRAAERAEKNVLNTSRGNVHV